MHPFDLPTRARSPRKKCQLRGPGFHSEAEGLKTIAFLDQTYFLLGLVPLLEQPSAINTRQLKTLVLPGGLGSTHKVLILGKGVDAPALQGCSFGIRVT